MARLFVYFFGLIASIIGMLNSDSDTGLFAVSSGFAMGFAIPLLDTIIANSRFLKLVWNALRTWKGRVRISASYLYRIQVDGDYLLVKGQRFDQYQPVGGVYKTHPSSSGRLRDMNVLNDSLLTPDAVSEGDLRVRIPGRNLVSFVRWFEGERGRETDCWREFHEELIATGILPQEEFGVIRYDRIERLYRPMKYSPWAESQELLIADIVELLPSPGQLVALRQLKTTSDSRILWAQEDQIRRRGAAAGAASQRTHIAQTAEWTIDAAI